MRYRGVRFWVRVRFEKREKVRVRVRVRFEKREKVRVRVRVRSTNKGAVQIRVRFWVRFWSINTMRVSPGKVYMLVYAKFRFKVMCG